MTPVGGRFKLDIYLRHNYVVEFMSIRTAVATILNNFKRRLNTTTEDKNVFLLIALQNVSFCLRRECRIRISTHFPSAIQTPLWVDDERMTMIFLMVEHTAANTLFLTLVVYFPNDEKKVTTPLKRGMGEAEAHCTLAGGGNPKGKDFSPTRSYTFSQHFLY